MKWISTLVGLLITSAVFAQPGYSLNEELHSYNGSASQNVYKLFIEKAQKKDVLKGLEKRLESGTKQDATVSTNKITIEKVVYKDYWSDSLVIDVEIVEVESGTMCFFLLSLDTTVISSKTHPELDVKIHRYLRKFGLDMYDEALEDEMEVEKKQLKAIEKEHRSTLNDIDKSNAKIESNKLEIELKNDEIDMNKADRQTKITEMEVQKMVVTNSADESAEVRETEKAKLKTLKSDYKKLKKHYKKLNKQISKMENNSRDVQLEKEKLVVQEKNIRERVDAQVGVVEQVKAKQDEVQVALNSLK